MNFWEYMEARADRIEARRLLALEKREARTLILIEKGLDWRSIVTSTVTSWDPRLLIALTIIGLFGWAFSTADDKDTRNLMVGALIAAFAGAWGYYLGSSSNAAKAGERADEDRKITKQIVELLPPPPPALDDPNKIELEPGEEKVVAGVDEGGRAPPARP